MFLSHAMYNDFILCNVRCNYIMQIQLKIKYYTMYTICKTYFQLNIKYYVIVWKYNVCHILCIEHAKIYYGMKKTIINISDNKCASNLPYFFVSTC